MRKSITLLFASLLLLGVACQSDSSEAQKEALNEVLLSSPNKEASVPNYLSDLFYPNNGVFRGIDFTMDNARVQALESGRPLVTTDSVLTFTINLNLEKDEFVDYSYVFEDGNLDRILVDIFSPTASHAKDAFEDISTMFDRKYKKRANLWDGAVKDVPFSAFVSLIEEDPGVTIVYERIEIN